MGNFAKAADNYEKVLALDPNFVPALNNLAYIYSEKLNNLNRAGELARKARELAPADPSVQDTFGWILYRQGKLPRGDGDIGAKCLKIAGKGEIQFHLRMANYMMGRSDEARADFEKAVAASDDFPRKDEAKNRLALPSVPPSRIWKNLPRRKLATPSV